MSAADKDTRKDSQEYRGDASRTGGRAFPTACQKLLYSHFAAVQHDNVAFVNFVNGAYKFAVSRDAALTIFQLLEQPARYAAFFSEIALQRDAFVRIYGKNQLCHFSEPPVRRERIRPL